MRRRDLIATGLAGTVFPGLVSPWAYATTSRPKRVALVCAGHYERYDIIFEAFILELCRLGILKDRRLFSCFNIEQHYAPQQSFRMRDLWDSLAKFNKSQVLEFPADAFYDYSYDEDVRHGQIPELLLRIKQRSDIDLVFACGSRPCEDLIHNVSSIPVQVLDCPAADSLGLLTELRKRGKKNFHFRCDTQCVFKQIQLYHQNFKFKRLGMVYAKERELRSHVQDVRQACERLGIDLVLAGYYEKQTSQDGFMGFDKAFEEIRRLVNLGVDAFYFSFIGSSEKQFSDLIDFLIENKIPAFSQIGADQVRRGLLFGMSDRTLQEYGAYEAWVLQKILKGKQPGDIPFEIETTLRIAVNLKTALLMEIPLNRLQLMRIDETFTQHFLTGKEGEL